MAQNQTRIASFNLFKNAGDNAGKTTYRKFLGEGKHEDVTADFFASNVEETATGAGIKDTSQAGNGVVRFNVGIKSGESTTYYRGTLNVSTLKADAIAAAKPNAEKMPDYFGTASTKKGEEVVEFDVAGWKVTTKADGTPAKAPYINVTINTLYQKTDAAPAAAATAAAAGTNFDF